MRTHYHVLGVAADTPPVVIKAAFRALAKEYHPDGRSQDEADPARFIEIQRAYAILSDPVTRDAYDHELRQTLVASAPMSETGAGLASHSLGADPAADPEIQRIRASLCLYSEALGEAFLRAVAEGICGDDPQAYGKMLERNFFREYFGDDADVQALARLLLLRSRTGAALTLNELVAGGTAPGVGIGLAVSQIIDRHLADEALFAEWLRLKFGAGHKPRNAVASGRRSAGRGNARAPEGVQPAHTLRSAGLLCFWALALYFALFTAFPLVQ